METRALICLLGFGLFFTAIDRPAQAQPASPTVSADRKAAFEEIFKKLNLTPRQKIAIAKIVRNAKASGQERAATAEQIAQELTPDQKKILYQELKAEAAAKTPGTP